jgi:hydrogenase/urease accessory protein HupE
LLIVIASPRAIAHPLSQGALDVTVGSDAIAVRARVTREEVRVTNLATTPGATAGEWADTGRAAFEQHAAYLAAHLHMLADGVELPGGVAEVTPPNASRSLLDNSMASYTLVYPLIGKPAPRRIELKDDVLTDGSFAPGAGWEATYVVKISYAGGPSAEGMLLTRANPITFNRAPIGDENDSSTAARPSRAPLFKAYFLHGVRHILTGYDHLLFVSALVLAATTLWDLIKVVSAFTLAHTITLTLAALNLVHLPERVVEPLISLSIVFVALQNVFWPRRAVGWTRLAAAFFFGLFHGLGFAGGLLDAMQQMQGATILLAILAFSVGVEAGHQMVVIPLFAILKIARHSRETSLAKDRFSFAVQRLGSAAISLAGMFYLFQALKPG